MKKQLVLALALAAAPFAASAGDQLSYNYIEGGYSQSTVDFDGGSLDLDGFGLKGSMALGDKFHGSFGFHQNEVDGSDATLSPAEIALGYHRAIGTSPTDFIGEISYIGANSEFDGEDYHNDGYRAAVGVRSAVGQHVELGAKLTYTAIEEMDSIVGVNVNAQVKFNQTWGAVAEYHYNEFNFLDGDISTWQIGLRASF